jgi:hypothetical protein
MEIVVTRRWRTDHPTLSSVTVDGKAQQFILEDRDRGLTSNMTLADILREKVYGKTAIPTGRYQVAITFSNRFKRDLPLLIGVPALPESGYIRETGTSILRLFATGKVLLEGRKGFCCWRKPDSLRGSAI